MSEFFARGERRLTASEYMALLAAVNAGVRRANERLVPAGPPMLRSIFDRNDSFLDDLAPLPPAHVYEWVKVADLALEITPERLYRLVLEAVALGGTHKDEINGYLEREFGWPAGSQPHRFLSNRIGADILAVQHGPPGQFRPRVIRLPGWAIIGTLCSAVVTAGATFPLWLSPVFLLGLGATLKGATSPIAEEDAQVIAELYRSTDRGRRRSCSKPDLLANVNASRQQARQPPMSDDTFARALRRLCDLDVIKQDHDAVHWDVRAVFG